MGLLPGSTTYSLMVLLLHIAITNSIQIGKYMYGAHVGDQSKHSDMDRNCII